MAIFCNIQASLNLVLFICEGIITGGDLFHAGYLATQSEQFQEGMIVVVDFYSGEDGLEFEEIDRAVRLLEQAVSQGPTCGKIVILSASTGIHLLVETIQLVSSKTELQLKPFTTLGAAVDWLELAESKQDILRFWREARAAVGLPDPDLALLA